MAKIYYSIIILSLFIISSCAPGSPPSESVILYKVNITAEPNEAGTVSPDSLEVDEGEEIEITASPNENWIFDSWQGDHNGNTNPATIMVDSDKTISALFIKREYPLTISVEGEGTVSERVLQNKTTDYPQGTTVELTANPSTGWVFSHWVGDVDTDGNPLEIVVEEAQEVTAVFVIREFNLEINIEGEGTVSEQVVEDDSTAIELTANPADGWTFVEWNGDVSGSDNPVQITMDETKEVTAVFERRDYPLTVNIEGEGTVTEEVIQARTTEYAYGTTVELTANPADGWTFTGWSGDLSGSENPTQIDITEEKEVTAVFQEEKDFYALTIETEGEGSVSTELESGDESDGLYENGSVVELTASVADEWVFSHWEGSVDGDENPVSVEMNSDKTISAVFVPREYPLTVNIEGEGTVTEEVIQPRTTDYPSGTIVQITATPANGWTFSHWDDDLTGGENPVEIEITEATEVTAIFERDFFDLTTQTDGNGSVTETLQSGNESSGEYEYESVVELSAAPDEGWSFIEWEGDLDESTNPQTITIDSDKNITAVFREDEVEIELFTLTINTGGNGSGATSPESGEYDEGTEIQLTATPNEGSSFSHWEGEEIDGEENLQVTIEMDSDKEVTAIFEEDEVEIEQFTLTINTDGNGAFTPESGSVFDEDSDVELTATPDDGWTFSHWQGEEIDGTENSETTITMDSNKTVTAVFEEVIEQFTLIINTDGNGTFTPESGSVFDEDSDVELTATPDDGWAFSHWQGEEIDGTEDSETTITMDSNKTVTAVFEEVIEQFTLIINTDGNGAFTPESGSVFDEDSDVELTATPDDGWAFSHWQGEEIDGTEDSETTITMDSNKTVTAVFEEVIEQFTLIINTDGNGAFTPESGSVFDEDSDVELTATPDDGWTFSHWEGEEIDGTENSETTITMDSDKNVTAVFDENPEQFTLTIIPGENGEIDVDPESDDGMYLQGEEVELTAIANDDYIFSHWIINSEEVEGSPTTITMDSDKSITAVFE